MRPVISADERDALYEQILDRLSGIGDIEMAIKEGNYVTAEQLGREYSDDLRLLLDDLGIGDGKGGPIELSSPEVVLRRTLPRLQRLAKAGAGELESEWIETSQMRERNRLVSEACEHVMARLNETGSGSAFSIQELG